MTRLNFKANASEDGGNFPPIPEGEYILTCTEVRDGQTKGGGGKPVRQMTTLVLTVADGAYEGRKVWHQVTWIPAGEPGHGLAIQALKAFGMLFDGDLEVDTDEFRGTSCKANVIIEEYNGKKNNKIPPGGFVTVHEEPTRKAANEEMTKVPASAGAAKSKARF